MGIIPKPRAGEHVVVYALPTGAKPSLRAYAIGRNVVTARIENAEGEHSAAVALVGGSGEQLESAIEIARAAACIDHNLGQRDHGIGQPGFGSTRKPPARCGYLCPDEFEQRQQEQMAAQPECLRNRGKVKLVQRFLRSLPLGSDGSLHAELAISGNWRSRRREGGRELQ